ncbi:MAG: acyl-CoA mutase large subunit family protein [Desulfobacterota bacterium]|nr:acyl-CoA mutase large subunit family protein [Thermodesulfobacteriota bacterium]MDW8002587.1 methylmalonyl-CoA mutase family protein [Deltaproteobacteria bacterium]
MKREIDFDAYIRGERPKNFKTASGIEVKEFYTIEDVKDKSEIPGQYPFTRGIHRDMYRGRFWTRRQQTGYGTPEESNRRMKAVLRAGQTGLNIDVDVVVKLGLDPDHPLAFGDIGLVGTSISTFEDMEKLFDGIPLDKVSTTLIVSPPASLVIMAMYILLARKNGIPEDALMGTVMNDSFNQLVGPTKEAELPLFPIEANIKIGIDLMEYCVKRIPKWNILNVNAYNMRETCLDAKEEAAFAMCIAKEYIKRLIERGLDIDDFAGRIGFFSDIGMDFFEEIAKIRAMRRIWAKMLKEEFKVKKERSLWFRTAIQTSGLALTAKEPLNNIARATIQTLAAVLAGAQSIHTTSYDEAYALPTEEAQKLSIRIQEILAYETGITKVADPLGGSYFVEWLTDKLEEEILKLMEEVEKEGGFLECYKKGWVDERIAKGRKRYAERIEKKEDLIVGVNIFEDDEEKPPISISKVYSSTMQKSRIDYVREYKKRRDTSKVKRALESVYREAKKGSNVFFPILDAVESMATLGEICEALRRAYDFELRIG